MPFFSYSYPVPTLLPYLFEADLVVSIIPPQSFTVISTITGQAALHWDKDVDTSNANSDLYTEVYRSEDMTTWTKLATLAWVSYDYYTDYTGLIGKTYYYQVRFIRKDILTDAIISTSDYAVAQATRLVSMLGFEPQDAYSNMFFQYLIKNLIGTRIYDQTNAATFAADAYDWQTTCRITDPFKLTVDGSTQDEQPANATALYSKRLVDFRVGKKQVKVQGQDTITGEFGELIPVNSYIIHTFLMSYAVQFLNLYEQYLTIVTNKYVDYSQVYAKGFVPVVSSRIDPTLAELYLTIGKLLRLEPPKANSTDQALVRYRDYLKSSFGNQDNTGMLLGINNAAENILGTTTQTLLEHWKHHWFKTDREVKLYVMPSGNEQRQFITGKYGNSNLVFVQTDDRFTTYVEFNLAAMSGVGPYETLTVLGSSPDNPYTYLFSADISHGKTTGTDLENLFATNPVASSIMTVTNSGGGGATPITEGMLPELLRMHSQYVGWENTSINLYGRKFRLSDFAPTVSGTDLATMSVMISEYDPTRGLICGTVFPNSLNYIEDLNVDSNGNPVGLSILPSSTLVIARDDASEGVGFVNNNNPITLYGDKHIVFTMGMTVSKMQWVTKAYLKIFIQQSTAAGYLRLYRVKKKYNYNDVCWNYREKVTIPSGAYQWNGSAYAVAGGNYVTADWSTAGASDSTDSVLLKEFYIDKVNSGVPTWATLDITDVIQNIYKYETSRLDMGLDPENVLQDGFMLTAEGFPNKSVVLIHGHSDSTFKPQLVWERFSQGFYQCQPDATTYFYVDGTLRYGQLQVMQSDREPISYVKTVNERIRQQDIHATDDIAINVVGSVPVEFVAGVRIYGSVTGSIGSISSVSNSILYVEQEVNTFSTSDVLTVLSSTTPTLTISNISYSGNKYVKLSRMPVSNSILRVFHTGSDTTPVAYPGTYPNYTPWTEAGAGITPVFIASAVGVQNENVTQDSVQPDIIYLNSTDTFDTIGDVVVTYQYFYDYYMLGRTISDSDSVTEIQGSSRVGNGLYVQSESDYMYRSELMLPMPSNGLIPDISGVSISGEYSDHNLGLVVTAIENIRRLDGPVDVFKYDPNGRPYRFGQSYHSFFERA